MPDAFYGFIAGMIIGLVAATIIAILVAPPNVSYQHLEIEGRDYDCVAWDGHATCEKAAPPLVKN